MPDKPHLELLEAAARAIRAEASPLADKLRKAAEDAQGSEEQLIMASDSLISDFARRFGLRWEPRGERRVIWPEGETKRKGSIDRLFDRVVVEFEAPGSLYPTNAASANQHALRQARNYMDGLIREEGWQEKSVAGVVTDGFRFIYCRFSEGRWIQEAPLETSPASVGRFLRLLMTFQRPPLLPDVLLQRFGAGSEITFQAVTAFYEALTRNPKPITAALFRQWQDFFADIAGLSPEALAEKKELVKFAKRVVGKEDPDPADLLFALYTYSALLTKLLAVLAVTPFFDTDDLDRITTWASLPENERRSKFTEVENGKFFRRLGIQNFTEGDFFGWYCSEWTSDIADATKSILDALSEYDPDAVEQAPERVRDLLKRLYHGLFPRAVRHDLGEYYTPDWLAERLLAQLDNDLFGEIPASEDKRQAQAARVKDRIANTRFLDPACGSGTFLVLILRRLREWARECGLSERETLLPALTARGNVMGFDLNPLAVISSRANYLLAIGDLIDPDHDLIEIPVYLADSIVLPAQGNGEGLFDTEMNNYRLPLRGVDEVFTVPVGIADPERLALLARTLSIHVGSGLPTEKFVDYAEKSLKVSGKQFHHIRETIGKLYDMLTRLHTEGRNGIWADIARNMFMPLFVQKADFVVGNPPWVNWESLPQEYREKSKEIWARFGLFQLKGYEAQLGKSQDDISMLLTYVACEHYLQSHGRLGFVITQSVFQTGAGQGFRRFRIGTGDYLKVVVVDDFSRLQVFEGATNRTSVLILDKGRSTNYPVPYFRWRKAGSASVPFAAKMQAALPYLKVERLVAEPIDRSDNTSPWITGLPSALKALRKAIGRSDYRARNGAHPIGANAVFWLRVVRRNGDGTVEVQNITEGAKREINGGQHTLEPDLLFPLLRGREMRKWRVMADKDCRFLVTHFRSDRLKPISEEILKTQYPWTFAYLSKYESVLRQRKSRQIRRLMEVEPYALYAIGEYTFAPYKVAWREIAGEFSCCVIESGEANCVVPDHKLVFVPCDVRDDAHFICALLNSCVARLVVQSYSIGTQFGPNVMERVRVPAYDSRNPTHLRLSELSKKAHELAAGMELMGSLAEVEREIDECAAKVWGLTEEELEAIRRSLED